MGATFIQGAATNYSSTGTSKTQAFGSNVTAGNLLIVFVSNYSANVTLTAVDDLGQTYTRAGYQYNGSEGSGIAVFYFLNTAGGPCTVTVTSSSAQLLTISVAEYSGVSSYNTVLGANGVSNSPSPGTITASSGDLIIAGYAQASFFEASDSVSSPFTIRTDILNGSSTVSLTTADDVSASGNETPIFTAALSTGWCAIGASFSTSINVAVSGSNTLTVTQSVNIIFLYAVTNSLIVTQNCVEAGDNFASNALTITQSVIVKQPNIHVNQNLVINQVVHGGRLFTQSVSTSLTLHSTTSEASFKPESVTQSLTFTQSATELKTSGFRQSLTPTQSVHYVYAPHWAFNNQTLTINQSINKSLFKSDANVLVITQAVTPKRVFARSVTSTLHIGGNAIASAHTASRNSFTIAQSVTRAIVRNRNTNQHLTLTQSVNVSLILNRAFANTLTFKHEHQIPDGTGNFINVNNLIITKGGFGGGPCCPVSRRTTTLIGWNSTIVMKNPELGDSEAPVSAVKIIRTVTGGIYTYVRKNASRKLKYKFLITRRKAAELRLFLLQNLTKKVQLINFKGENWLVNFLSDPVDLIARNHGEPPCGELYEIELDFQGIKIN